MTKHPTFTIKQVLKDHWNDFVKSNSKFNIRPIVFKEVNKVIYCGDFSQGHALYQCSHCGSILHVPFRCKSRFCNTCGMQYVNNRAFNLSKKLIKCKHLLFKMLPQSERIFHERYSHWRVRILLSFDYDPIKCTCGHIMELVDIFYPPHLSYNSS